MTILRRARLSLLLLAAATAGPIAAAPAPSASAPAAASAAEMRRMTRMLDELDRQQLDDMLRKARACARSRDFDCSEKWLDRARKRVHTQSDRDALAEARADLGRERRLLAQEQELARLQREEEARAEREAREREREEWAERQAREEADRQQTRAELFADLGNKMQEIGRVYEESGRQVQQAQALAAQINRDRQDAANREYERKRAEREAEYRRSQDVAAARQRSLDQMREAHEAERQRQDERDRARREAEEKERLAREEKQQQLLAQQQAAEERQRRAAEADAARRAEAEASARADADYLRAVAAGTRLVARKCPGGEGNYFPVGIRPRISPQRVACIDLDYTATCPGSTARSVGRIANFQGLSTDCFMGDALADHPIQPRPACPVEQVSLRVDAITPCR